MDIFRGNANVSPNVTGSGSKKLGLGMDGVANLSIKMKNIKRKMTRRLCKQYTISAYKSRRDTKAGDDSSSGEDDLDEAESEIRRSMSLNS